MALLKFVQPETVRLYLGPTNGTGGDWIEVKKRLSVGEARLAVHSFVGSFNTDGSRTPNLETLGMGQVLAYLVNWSARDANDLPVPVSLDAIKALDLASYAAIEKAIEAHVAAVEAEEESREKKLPASTEPASSAIS